MMMTTMMLVVLIYFTILLQLFETVNFSFFSAEDKLLEINFDDISNILDMNNDGFWKSHN